MAKIQPISIWYNGNQKTADELTVILVFDNLIDKAVFNYNLRENIIDEGGVLMGGIILNDGYVNMESDDYINWDNSNQAAYVYVANKINVTLI